MGRELGVNSPNVSKSLRLERGGFSSCLVYANMVGLLGLAQVSNRFHPNESLMYFSGGQNKRMKQIKNLRRFPSLVIASFVLPILVLTPVSVVGQGAPVPSPVDPAASTAEVKSNWPDKAPNIFKVKFECSHGDIVVEVHKDWSPIGAEHFFDLAKIGYYNDVRFFRVVPGFMAQFGISGDPEMTKNHGNKNIMDDPNAGQSNSPGMMTYAKTGLPNSRSTQLFINTGDNKFLDSQGFTPFAKVVEGMDVVKKINSEYREKPNQMSIRSQGNVYLNKAFPNLDYIKRVIFVE